MSGQSFDDRELEVERYELREPGKYRFAPDRRCFVQTMSSGMVIAVAVHGNRRAHAQRGPSARRDEPLSERFHLGVDGILTVFTSKVEVGQGSRTQLTQAASEEMGLPIDRIRLVMADTQFGPDDGGTAGSRTTPSTVPRVRTAAATLREILAEHAASRLQVPRSELTIANGTIEDRAGRRLTLAELAFDTELAAKMQAGSPDRPLSTPERWHVLGTSVSKVNAREVVTGAARYPSDTVRPGMLYGKVLRPISYGARLTHIDLATAQHMQGVVVVQDEDFVGCAAKTTYQATKARDALAASARWDRPEHPSSGELFLYLKEHVLDEPDNRATSGSARSDRGAEPSALRLQADYTIAYVQHAPMEPRAAVAEWDGDRLTVWTGSQQPARVQSELSRAFRIPEEKVRVIIPDTGGGFGGKHTGEAAVEAARLSKAAGAPVSLRWTREEEFTWAYFRPAGLIEVEASVDAAGKLNSWNFVNYNSGGSAIDTPYRIPGAKSRFVATDAPLRQGSYRALASTANTFARESAMDELAKLAAIDPLAFRLQNLDDGRLKDVLLAAVNQFQWQERSQTLPPGHGIGLACGTEKGSYVAACAEVVMRGDDLRIVRICQAFECGAIQNPRNLQAQVEGSILMGLGAALTEQIEFENGQITTDNFSSYQVPRMRDLPELDIVLVDRPDLASVGGSETPIIAVAPAIANALYRATGIRSRSMPLQTRGST